MMHYGEKRQQKSTTKAVKKLEKNILVSRTSMEQVSAFAENRGSQPVCRDPLGVERSLSQGSPKTIQQHRCLYYNSQQ